MLKADERKSRGVEASVDKVRVKVKMEVDDDEDDIPLVSMLLSI